MVFHVKLLPTTSKSIIGFYTQRGKSLNLLRIYRDEVGPSFGSLNHHIYLFDSRPPLEGEFYLANDDIYGPFCGEKINKFQGVIVASTNKEVKCIPLFGKFLVEFVEKWKSGKKITKVIVPNYDSEIELDYNGTIKYTEII